MPGRERRTSGHYEEESLEEVRCPSCGNEDEITKTVAVDAQPVPLGSRATCPKCDHRDHPMAFHHEWKWHRMDENERQEALEAADREASRMAEHQYSAAYISESREP